MVSKKMLGLLFVALVLAFSSAAAEERIEHFKGLQPASLEEAVKNFSEYNEKLAAILQQAEISPADLGEIHQLTYTLENALEMINAEFTALAETLEEVHVASETADYETARRKGEEYLATARKLIP
jgi:SMC interacting uncharacterized protein involved in chromosome segregation